MLFNSRDRPTAGIQRASHVAILNKPPNDVQRVLRCRARIRAPRHFNARNRLDSRVRPMVKLHQLRSCKVAMTFVQSGHASSTCAINHTVPSGIVNMSPPLATERLRLSHLPLM